MAIILYVWGFIIVPLIVTYGKISSDGREIYVLHGGAVLLALLVSLIMSSRQSGSPHEIARNDAVSSGDETDDHYDEKPVYDARVSHDVDETNKPLHQIGNSRAHDDTNDDKDSVEPKTPRYVRGAIVCATKLWSLISFAWFCLLVVSLVVSIHPGYSIGLGFVLLIVWLWGGLVPHPFPFSFFGFAMHIREWIQWWGLHLLLIVLTVFGNSGKLSIRLFMSVTIILLSFWTIRFVVPRIRRIRCSKFRLFRLLTGVWFVLLATIVFQAFLFTRGHIIQSRQHMQALMREYTLYQYISFFHDLQSESVVGSLIHRYSMIQPSSSVSQSLSSSDAGLSRSGLLFARSGNIGHETSTVDNLGRRKAWFDIGKKVKDHEPEQKVIRGVEPTFRNVLKFLLANYPKTTTRYAFTNIPSTDPDYAIFATARRLNMVGTDIDPNRIVVCQTFFVMKGLVGGWKVSGQGTIFDQYWNEARRRGVIGSCQWGQPVPQALISQ